MREYIRLLLLGDTHGPLIETLLHDHGEGGRPQRDRLGGRARVDHMFKAVPHQTYVVPRRLWVAGREGAHKGQRGREMQGRRRREGSD